MRAAFVRTLIEEAERDDRIMLLTGDLGFMALEPFRERFPDRFFNMGVAEQNMIGVATGLADAGYTPFCYSIVPFAVLRPFEFIRNGPVLHGLPVRIIGIGGGFEYGTAGPTHFGLEDIGAARLLQDTAVVAPADAAQTVTAVRAVAQWPGPAYVRIGKNDRLVVPGLDGRFEFGRVQQVRDGTDAIIFVTGSIAASVVDAADLLLGEGISAAVAVVSSINPQPVDDVLELVASRHHVIAIETHVRSGGVGSLIAEIIADHGSGCHLLRLGVDRPFGHRGGSEEYLNQLHGLTAPAIATRIAAFVGGHGDR
jgi:transketolase